MLRTRALADSFFRMLLTAVYNTGVTNMVCYESGKCG